MERNNLSHEKDQRDLKHFTFPFPVNTIHMACQSSRAPQHFDHGYIASPNYPGKYYMDAECFWKLSVQKRQTLKLTIFDFELDVKKGGQCSDYLEVYAGERTYFKVIEKRRVTFSNVEGVL